MTMSSLYNTKRLARSARGTVAGGQAGFTLVEVLTAIVVLGVVGAAVTYLFLRLTGPLEATVKYEQLSLAANAAADRIWGLFREDEANPPSTCFAPLQDVEPDGPWERVDVNYSFTFRCTGYPEDDGPSDQLYVVQVWLRRERDGQVEEPFEMLALVGGYSAREDEAEDQ